MDPESRDLIRGLADEFGRKLMEMIGGATPGGSPGSSFRSNFISQAQDVGLSSQHAEDLFRSLPKDKLEEFSGAAESGRLMKKSMQLHKEADETLNALQKKLNEVKRGMGVPGLPGSYTSLRDAHQSVIAQLDKAKAAEAIANRVVEGGYSKEHGEFLAPKPGQPFGRIAAAWSRSESALGLNEVRHALAEGDIFKAGGRLGSNILNIPYLGGAIKLAGAPYAAKKVTSFANQRAEGAFNARVGNPTMMGIASGIPQGEQGIGDNMGNYISSLFAMPTMMMQGWFNDNANPDLLGSMSNAAKEGWQMKGRAFRRAFNPFDMLTQSQSMDIVQGVSRRGFRSPGTRMQVEEAISELVQRTAIDAGTSLNILDMAIRRLGVDVNDTKNFLLSMGQQARAAGKDINQFTQETQAVLQGISSQGATGRTAMYTSALMSGIPQVSGERLNQLFSSPEMVGLSAAYLGRAGSPFNNSSDLITMATGNLSAIGGGEQSLSVMQTQFQVIKDLVAKVGAGRGNTEADRIATYSQVSMMLGGQVSPQEIRKIVENSDQIIDKARIMQKISNQQDMMDRIEEPNLAMQLKKNPKSKEALSILRDPLKGRNKQSPASAMYRENLFGSTLDIGYGGDKEFEGKVKKMYGLIAEGNIEEAMKYRNEITAQTTPEEGRDVFEASEMLLKAQKGDDKAWDQLNKKFGIRVKGSGGKEVWDSDKFKNFDKYPDMFGKMLSELPDKGKALKSSLKGVLGDARKAGLINNYDYKDLFTQYTSGKLSKDELGATLMERMSANQQSSEGKVVVTLSTDARKLLRLVDNRPGSAQGLLNAANGINGRADTGP